MGAHLGAKMGQVRAKMALSWPTSRQDVAKMAHMEPKMGILRALLGGSWRLFLDLGRDLAKIGYSWWPCWFILARCWAMLGQLGAILEQLSDKMRPKSAKMSQDSARWPTRAPRRGKIGELSGPGGSQTGSAGGGGW